MKKVLFLTNNDISLNLYDWLKERCREEIFRNRLTIQIINSIRPDLIISYNYRYIIPKDVIECMKGNIINLHISLLPWNRGASPNFWSSVEETPKGVTIHQINSGLDEGKLIYQKECLLDPEKETFETSYNKLNYEITELFKQNWDEIREGSFPLCEQIGEGSYHTMGDLNKLREKCPFQWSDNIADFIERYHFLCKAEKSL